MRSALVTNDLEPGAIEPVLDALDDATDRLQAVVADVPEAELEAPSLLDGWSRLTVLAHLRAGAVASARLTEDALAGRPAAFYPGGAPERERSLQPREGESPAALVADLFAASDRLSQQWRGLGEDGWAVELREPKLGRMRLTRIVALRLTEVEVHGIDLGLDRLTDWSERFVQLCLPLRIGWLPAHARALPSADRSVNGRWLLRSDTGSTWLVSAAGGLASAAAKNDILDSQVDCVIEGTERELLALTLGRIPVENLRISGNETLARSFNSAFPGP